MVCERPGTNVTHVGGKVTQADFTFPMEVRSTDS